MNNLQDLLAFLGTLVLIAILSTILLNTLNRYTKLIDPLKESLAKLKHIKLIRFITFAVLILFAISIDEMLTINNLQAGIIIGVLCSFYNILFEYYSSSIMIHK